MTPFAAFESDAPESLPSTLPPDARLPTDVDPPGGSELDHLAERVGQLSDAIHAEDGLIRRLFADAEKRAASRHEALLGALRDIGDEQLRTSEAVRQLGPEVERHRARLELLSPLSNGNGVDHG